MLHPDEIALLAEAAAEADAATLATARGDMAKLIVPLVERLDALEARPPAVLVDWAKLTSWTATTHSLPAGAIVHDDGSTFVALREAFGGPRDEPTSWRCIAAGMGAIAPAWADDCDRVLVLEFNQGPARVFMRLDLGPIPLWRGPWEEARGYEAGDLVTANGSQWIAAHDLPPGASPPGKGDGAPGWRLFAARGKTGRPGKGDKGDKGDAGLGLAHLSHANGAVIAELTDGRVFLPSNDDTEGEP